jgi:hypothetical protein
MQKAAKRPMTLAPVEEARGYGAAPVPHQHDQRMEEQHLRAVVRSERASAYWFAAAKWGLSGFFIGTILGATIMFLAMNASLPLAQDTMLRGFAIKQAAGALQGDANVTPPRQISPSE